MEFTRVDGGGAGIQLDLLAIGDHPRLIAAIHQGADLGQAPTQRTAGVVGNLPQQFAQLLTAKRAAVEG